MNRRSQLFTMQRALVMACFTLFACFSPWNEVIPSNLPVRTNVSHGVIPATFALRPMTAKQRRLARYIATEWRVGKEHAALVVKAIYSAAARNGVSPLLLLAMAGNESSFRHIGNPDGGHDPYKPYGLMQVSGRWHQEKFKDGVVVKTTIPENVELAAKVVREYLARENGNEKLALLRYNGSLNQGDKYYKRVSQIKVQLLNAATNAALDAV